MQGAWSSNRDDGSSGRLLYRCTLRGARSVPAELSDHPRSLYVREDDIVPTLDAWIANLTTPEALAEVTTQTPRDDANSTLRRQVSELDQEITALVNAVETGGEISALTEQLSRRSREREGLMARLRSTPTPAQPTEQEIMEALEEPGGIAGILGTADPADKAKLYLSLDIRLNYNHQERLVTATAGAACVQQRVRRGT